MVPVSQQLAYFMLLSRLRQRELLWQTARLPWRKERLPIGITLNPVNSTTKIKYHSDNPRVATVNKYGKIKTKRAGEATIYGTTSTGLYGYCDVLVVDLNRKAVTLRPYDTERLHVQTRLVPV